MEVGQVVTLKDGSCVEVVELLGDGKYWCEHREGGAAMDEGTDVFCIITEDDVEDF